MKIPSNSLYELVSNRSIKDTREPGPYGVPLAGIRMASNQFECFVRMMRNGRWGGGRGEGVADAGVHLQYFPH